MTFSTEIQPPQNLSRWLLRDPKPASKAAEKAIAEPLRKSTSTVLAKLSHIARASLGRQVVNGLKKLLPGDMTDVFRAAWGDYEALVEAGAASVQQPHAERVVTLKDQKVSFAQEPTFDVLVDGTTLLTVKGHLEVVFTLSRPEAVVRAGRLVEVHAGHASVSGLVQVEDLDIAKDEYVWPFEFVLEFDPGVELSASASLPMRAPRRSAA